MSERVVPIRESVPTAVLERAVIRLDSRRHPEKLAAIDKALQMRYKEAA